jgi:Zn-dependent peptidase ImmA (M78 family)
MPEEIINFVTKNCWFFSSMEDAWAFTFTGNDLKDKHLIFLSDELLNEHPKQIMYSIAHEIGHVILKHRNSTLVKQSKAEIKQQEAEADEFAKRFIF